MLFSENISNFLDFCRETSINYRAYKEIEDKCWDATQDCLHQLEFGDYKDRQKTATLLANIRKYRRYYKENREIMEEFYNFTQSAEYLKFYKMATEVLGKTRKIESKKSNKQYSIKRLKGLDFLEKTFNTND